MLLPIFYVFIELLCLEGFQCLKGRPLQSSGSKMHTLMDVQECDI